MEIIISGGLTRLSGGNQAKMMDVSSTVGSSDTYVKEFNIESDAIAAGVWVNSAGAGASVTVNFYTLPEDDKPFPVINFTTITAPTSVLRFQKSAITLQRIRIEAVVVGDVDFQVYVRAINAAGEASTRLLGASNIEVSQEDVTNTAAIIIPADIVDRVGILMKNWSSSGTAYVAESQAKATASEGFPVGPKGTLMVNIESGTAIWAYSPDGPVDMRIIQATAG